jgi:serine phosphatase RsbU (regulator of sigma subunit)
LEIIETFDRFLTLPREQAYNQYLDERNLKIFKVMLTIFSIIFTIAVTVNLVDNQSLNLALVLGFLNLIALITAMVIYKKYFNVSNIRRSIFIFLILQLFVSIAIKVVYPEDNDNEDKTEEVKQKNDDNQKSKKKDIITRDSSDKGGVQFSMGRKNDDSFVQYILFFGIMVLIFRFSRTEVIQLFAVSTGAAILTMFFLNSSFTASSSLPNLIMAMIFFVIAITSEQKRRRKFFEQYDVYYAKNYENLRMKKELNYAREIQLSMLPENDAVIGDIEISGISLPASEVGGDYFDYFKVSDNEVGIFICDVSGHGVASGLLLSGLRSCMHLILEDNTNPKFIIEKLNRMIRKTQSRKMFVTAIFAIIDTEKNKCMLYNAGHLPPYKISGESKEIFKIKKHGLALGAMNTVEAEGASNEVVFDFNKGDKLILYTDGVNEAMNSSKSEYGLDNLELYLNNNADKKTNELLNGLINDVKKFTNNSMQRDDLTLLIIQRN